MRYLVRVDTVRVTPLMAAPGRMALAEVGQELGPGVQLAHHQPQEHTPRKGYAMRDKLADLSLILLTHNGEQNQPA